MSPLAREQLVKLLDARPERVGALRAAIIEGRIDGDEGWFGRCGCVMAHLFGDDSSGYVPPIGRVALGTVIYSMSEIEFFVSNVRPGQTPAISEPLRAALAIVDEWIAVRAA